MSALRKYEQEVYRPEICNVDEEGIIIGTLLMFNDAYQSIGGFLEPKHFSEPILGEAYEVIGGMIKQGKSAIPETIKSYLPWGVQIGKLTDENDRPLTVGKLILRSVTGSSIVPTGLPHIAESIKKMYKRRMLAKIGQELVALAHDVSLDNDDPNQIGEKTMSEIGEALSDSDEIYGAVSLGASMDEALDIINNAQRGKKKAGINYRFRPVEKLIGPMCGGQLIILGGATKQGKSALAGQLVIGAASEGFPVWIYSGEMTHVELAMREMSRDTNVSVKRQKQGQVIESDYERLMKSRNTHYTKQVFIQEKKLNLDQIEERVRFFVAKKGKGLIVIDHLGLIDRKRDEKKMADWEFGQVVTARLKQIAREMDVPILACAQLKKHTFNENRGPLNEKFLHSILARRPRYTDLIGNIERDADQVIIPFRPVVFLKEHEPPEHSDLHSLWQQLVDDNQEQAKIVLALSREGNWPDEASCGWHGPTTSFVDQGGMNEPELIKREVLDNPMGLL